MCIHVCILGLQSNLMSDQPNRNLKTDKKKKKADIIYTNEELEKVCPSTLVGLQEIFPNKLIKIIFEFIAKFNEPYRFTVVEDKSVRMLFFLDANGHNNIMEIRICRWCGVSGNHSEIRRLIPVSDWRNEGWGKIDYDDDTDVMPSDWRPDLTRECKN